jgi:SsrA-binding protein
VASGGGRKNRKDANKVLARNRKARHEYAIDETCEAGLALVGSEVKSIRDGKVALVDAYAVIEKGEAWLCELEIGVYAFAHARNHDPRRRRKLLLHRTEIDRLADKVRGKGLTMVPLSLYEKEGRVKVELALVHGKQEYDRRDDVKKREAQREIDRGMASRRKVDPRDFRLRSDREDCSQRAGRSTGRPRAHGFLRVDHVAQEADQERRLTIDRMHSVLSSPASNSLHLAAW